MRWRRRLKHKCSLYIHHTSDLAVTFHCRGCSARPLIFKHDVYPTMKRELPSGLYEARKAWSRMDYQDAWDSHSQYERDLAYLNLPGPRTDVNHIRYTHDRVPVCLAPKRPLQFVHLGTDTDLPSCEACTQTLKRRTELIYETLIQDTLYR